MFLMFTAKARRSFWDIDAFFCFFTHYTYFVMPIRNWLCAIDIYEYIR